MRSGASLRFATDFEDHARPLAATERHQYTHANRFAGELLQAVVEQRRQRNVERDANQAHVGAQPRQG